MWKASQFNIIRKIDDDTIIWNSRTGAVAKLDNEVLHYLINPANTILADNTVKLLAENGFIVPYESNEAEEIIANAKDATMNADGLYYVIAPTLACNYRCTYCFENGRTIYTSMTPEIAAAVVKFIEAAILKRKRTDYLHINWFGGEPLLQIETIKKLSMDLIALCRKYKIQYRASIVTNGRFLDKSTAELLRSIKINRVQISVDGTEKHYCERKQASAQDYKVTLNNIKSAADVLHNIVVRINTSHGDFTEAYKLTKLLLTDYQLNGKIKISCANTYEGTQEDRMREYPIYASQEESFRNIFGKEYSKNSYHGPRSRARRMTCGLVCRDRFCIGPEGELYKCEHHFGQSDHIVGTIFGERNPELIEEFENADLQTLNGGECKRCSVFPVCLGGCPNHTMKGENPFDCEAYKDYLFSLAIRP